MRWDVDQIAMARDKMTKRDGEEIRIERIDGWLGITHGIAKERPRPYL
jgi:hypothetical protein